MTLIEKVTSACGKPNNQLAMFISPDKGNAWVGRFLKTKHKILSTALGTPERLFIDTSAKTFIKLLKTLTINKDVDGLRIYFAAYKDLDPEDSFFEDKLTVIFAPTKSEGKISKDIGIYYELSFDGTSINQLIDKEPQKWVNNYKIDDQNTGKKCKWSILSEDINSNYPNRKGETLCLLYSIDKINELLCQLNHLLNLSIKIQGITIYFGAYDDEMKSNDYSDPNKPITVSIGGQMTLVFALTDNENKVIILSEMPPEQIYDKISPQITDLDTGDPCPPNGNCDGSLL